VTAYAGPCVSIGRWQMAGSQIGTFPCPAFVAGMLVVLMGLPCVHLGPSTPATGRTIAMPAALDCVVEPLPFSARAHPPGGLSVRLRGGKMKNTAADKKKAKAKSKDRIKGVAKAAVARRSARRNQRQQSLRSRQSRQEDDASPRIVALIPVSQSSSAEAALDRLLETCIKFGDAQSLPSAQAADKGSPLHPKAVTLCVPARCAGGRGRRVTLLRVDTRKRPALLDALKVADCAVLVHHGTELPAPSCAITATSDMRERADLRGALAIACLRAQGLPALVVAAATHTAGLARKVCVCTRARAPTVRCEYSIGLWSKGQRCTKPHEPLTAALLT
jgi:hypothetical protein